MVESLIVNTVLFLLLFFLAAKASSRKKISNKIGKKAGFPSEMFALFLIFAIVNGARYDVGVDYLNYLEIYTSGKILYAKKYELLFKGLTWIWTELHAHAFFFFFSIAFIQIVCFFLAFKDERFLYPLLVFFLQMNGEFFVWMNISRCAIAMCIWLASLKFLIEKKPLLYYLGCLIAFGFHRSAIILIVFYPFLRSGKDFFPRRSVQFMLIIGALLISVFFNSVFMRMEGLVTLYQNALGGEKDIYSNYDFQVMLDSIPNEQKGTGLAAIFNLAVAFIIILFSNKLKAFYPSKKFTIIYFFFILGLFFKYVFPPNTISLSRPFRYFNVFQSIVLAYFSYYLYKKRHNGYNKIILTGLIIAFLGIYYLSQVTASPNSHIWFQFFFQSKDLFYPS